MFYSYIFNVPMGIAPVMLLGGGERGLNLRLMGIGYTLGDRGERVGVKGISRSLKINFRKHFLKRTLNTQ